MRNVFKEDNCTAILKLFWENMEPQENNFCFYHRFHIRHYGTYTNSSHEGSNNGLKSGASPVLPQYYLDRSATVFSNNYEICVAIVDIEGSQDSTNHNIWSNLPTSAYLNKLVESLLTNEWELYNK